MNEINHPRLFNANKAIAEHFGVRQPAVYVDTKQKLGLAMAYFDSESIVVASGVEELFDDGELKALFAHETKHFYQRTARTIGGVRRNEHDADRAAVAATDMETIRSYVDKAAEMMIEKMVPFKPLKELILKIHRAAPGLLACATIFPTDREHPPVSKRLSEMQRYEDTHGSKGLNSH